MQQARIVEIFSEPPGQAQGTRGTGYLVTPSLILTSRHVVLPAEVGGTCKVRFFIENKRQSDFLPAEICWLSRDVDAALLSPKIGDPSWAPFVEGAQTVEFGEIVGRRPVQIDATGFAKVMTEGKRTDTLVIYGYSHPHDCQKSDRILIYVNWATPTDREGWKGVSGSAVFAGDWLVGVLKEVPEGFDSSALEAVPVTAFMTDREFLNVFEKQGINTSVRKVDAGLVSSLPDTDWEEVCKRYLAETVRTFCRFEMTGLSLPGSPEDRVLTAQDAYGGTQFCLLSEPSQKSLGLADLMNEKAAVIVGNPGAGKSGSLKMLINIASKENRGIPVLMPLASLATQTEISAHGIVEAISRHAVSQLRIPDATPQFFWRILSQNRCILFFDALDELRTRALREKAVHAIRELCDRAPGNRYFLTSRNAEYEETPVPASSEVYGVSFRKLAIEELGEGQIRDYLRIWFGDAGDIATRILDRSELIEMHPTPLLLNLMGRLAKDRELPDDKYTLYDEFIRTCLGSWEEMRGPDPLAPPPEVRREALEKIAWAAHHNDELLEDTAQQAISGVQGVENPLQVLAWLSKRSGILRQQVQYGQRSTRKTYQFAHQQLQEFLAGIELGNRLLTRFDESFEMCRSFIDDYRWDQLFRFAIRRVQLLSRKHNDLLKKLLLSGPERHEAFVLKAASLLNECDPDFTDRTVVAEIVDELVVIASSSSRDTSSLNHIYTLARSGFAAAHDVVENIALDNEITRNLLLDSFSRDVYYVDAILYLIYNGVASSNEAVDRAVGKTMDLEQLIRLANALPELNRKQQARELLTRELSLRIEVEMAEPYCFGRLYDALAALGFDDDTDALARHCLDAPSRNLFLKLESAIWLHNRDQLAADAVFRIAMDTLPNLPAIEIHSGDSMDAVIHIAMDNSLVTGAGNARKFISACLSHPRYSFYLIPMYMNLDDEIGEAAREAQEVIIAETGDSSRLRIMVRQIAFDEDDGRAVTRMIRLLENERALRWGGHDLLNGLVSRGRGAEAMVVLGRLATDESRGDENRRNALELIKGFQSRGESRSM